MKISFWNLRTYNSHNFLKTFSLLLIACSCSAPARATLLVIKFTAEEVWVAADSKANITRDKKMSSAQAQKVFELDDSCVFAGAGLAGSGDGTVLASDYARRKDTTVKTTPEERAHEFARTFSAPLEKILEDIRLKTPNEFFEFFLDKVAVTGMFVDYDKKPRCGVVYLSCRETSDGDIVIDATYPPPPTNFPALITLGRTEGALAAIRDGGRAFGMADSETQLKTMFDRQTKTTPLWVGPPYFMLTIDAKGVHWKHKPELHKQESEK